MIPKFRARDSTKKKFVEHFFITDNGLICNMEEPTSGYRLPIPFEKSELILMQSTGLFDKNNKEIFEGDVLKFNDEWNEYCHEGYVDGSVEGINFVEVVRGEACFEFGKTRYPESSLFIRMEDEHLAFAELIKSRDFEFEIIGNIYEKPEILKEKE
ncbi:YopX family protein [Streptococcus mitis]|uniref:YopX family protein n=1 Tax=Streptococcus mitis TaxID=28037 RepID=UPI0020017257|nr:YopX family protein [Streptococcus mitis]